jgi:hypothetical protein
VGLAQLPVESAARKRSPGLPALRLRAVLVLLQPASVAKPVQRCSLVPGVRPAPGPSR